MRKRSKYIFKEGKTYTYEEVVEILNENVELAVESLAKQTEKQLKKIKDDDENAKELFKTTQKLKTLMGICYYRNILLGDTYE